MASDGAKQDGSHKRKKGTKCTYGKLKGDSRSHLGVDWLGICALFVLSRILPNESRNESSSPQGSGHRARTSQVPVAYISIFVSCCRFL